MHRHILLADGHRECLVLRLASRDTTILLICRRKHRGKGFPRLYVDHAHAFDDPLMRSDEDTHCGNLAILPAAATKLVSTQQKGDLKDVARTAA